MCSKQKIAVYKLPIIFPIFFLAIIFPIFVLGVPTSEESFSDVTDELDEELLEINRNPTIMNVFKDSIEDEFLGFGVHKSVENQQGSTDTSLHVDICDTLDTLQNQIQRESLKNCPTVKLRDPQQARAAGLLAQPSCKLLLDDLLQEYPNCHCTSPALFTPKGAGNCNFGATLTERSVWCYISRQFGNLENICPDAQESQSRPGWHWSKFACIT